MKVERLLGIGIVAAVMALGWTQFARAQSGAGGTGASDITPTEEPASSPWGWLKMPTITMPKITMPKMPADPLAPVKSSARKVGDGTKRAWEGTKEIFTFGGSKKDESAPRVASSGEAPSMWQRMFGGGEEKKADEGPATVGEWMSQSRVE